MTERAKFGENQTTERYEICNHCADAVAFFLCFSIFHPKSNEKWRKCEGDFIEAKIPRNPNVFRTVCVIHFLESRCVLQSNFGRCFIYLNFRAHFHRFWKSGMCSPAGPSLSIYHHPVFFLCHISHKPENKAPLISHNKKVFKRWKHRKLWPKAFASDFSFLVFVFNIVENMNLYKMKNVVDINIFA